MVVIIPKCSVGSVTLVENCMALGASCITMLSICRTNILFHIASYYFQCNCSVVNCVISSVCIAELEALIGEVVLLVV